MTKRSSCAKVAAYHQDRLRILMEADERGLRYDRRAALKRSVLAALEQRISEFDSGVEIPAADLVVRMRTLRPESEDLDAVISKAVSDSDQTGELIRIRLPGGYPLSWHRGIHEGYGFRFRITGTILTETTGRVIDFTSLGVRGLCTGGSVSDNDILVGGQILVGPLFQRAPRKRRAPRKTTTAANPPTNSPTAPDLQEFDPTKILEWINNALKLSQTEGKSSTRTIKCAVPGSKYVELLTPFVETFGGSLGGPVGVHFKAITPVEEDGEYIYDHEWESLLLSSISVGSDEWDTEEDIVTMMTIIVKPRAQN